MTTTVIDEYILPALTRYIDRYRWSWSMSTRLINLYYGTGYTQKHLKALYQQNK